MKTAFEALKEYCENYLAPDEYRIVGETSSYLPTIYFMDGGWLTYQVFTKEGEFAGIGALDDDYDMVEHIEQAERERE